MAESAAWFGRTYRLTPPMSFQASRDWDQERNLSAQWYACANYRLGFLGEQGHLRIRDFFLYRQEYPSRYLNAPMDNAKSTFDALPVLFPQAWLRANDRRPFIRLLDESGNEPCGSICYKTLDESKPYRRMVSSTQKLVRLDTFPTLFTTISPYSVAML